jgi:hypothetical protein
MPSTLALGAWPGPTGLDPVAYYTEFLEQFQFHLPTGVLPSRSDDILGSYTGELQVVADSTGMQVKVSQGRCQIKGVFAKIKDADVSGGIFTLGPFTNADATNPRIDRVVLRANLSTGAITLQILAGTAAATPQPAAVTQNNSTWDLPLAQVYIPAASATIAPYQVMDERVYAATPAALADARPIENPIVNGGMGVWNGTFPVASAANGAVGAEMFVYLKSGSGVHDLIQSNDVPAGTTTSIEPYSTHLDVTTASASPAAGDYYRYEHRIEGRRVNPLAARGFTLPFWVNAAKVGYHAVSFFNSGNDRGGVCEYFVETAGTWLLKWIRVPSVYLAPGGGSWDYQSGVGLRLSWTLAAGSTFRAPTTYQPGTWGSTQYFATPKTVNEMDNTANNFKLAMVGRMTAGGLILPFAPHVDEPGLCKRYYERLYPSATGSVTNTHAFGNYFTYSAPKRAAPTITKVGTFTVINCGQPSSIVRAAGFSDLAGIEVIATANATGNAFFGPAADGSAYFEINGRL